MRWIKFIQSLPSTYIAHCNFLKQPSLTLHNHSFSQNYRLYLHRTYICIISMTLNWKTRLFVVHVYYFFSFWCVCVHVCVCVCMCVFLLVLCLHTLQWTLVMRSTGITNFHYNKGILAVPNFRFPLYCFCNPDPTSKISLVPRSLL